MTDSAKRYTCRQCRKRRAVHRGRPCGHCTYNNADRAFTQRMYALKPGERLALGAGWYIVRSATDTGPGAMARVDVPLPHIKEDS